ncbi:MAG: hypothetical protein PHU34_09890 [Candidatus Methanoperedens sp.]|nr:hypothetical protein [Candidatus Methanoperedens sp.]
MVKFKNIALVTLIGIVVLFSGCAGNQETKIAETSQPTAVQTTVIQPAPVKTPEGPYTVSVTEIKTLQDCIKSGETKPCTLINLEVRNNNLKSLDFKIVKEEVMFKSGKLLGDRYDREVGLSNLCVRQAGMEFKLNADTNQNVVLCYPVAHKSDAPSLNVDALINGERKEYRFDLIKYGLTD